MAGYTRPSGSANIANGNIIDATDLNGEFDSLEGAFNSSSGHSHDGTAGGGARITETGPGGQYTFTTDRMEPSSGQTLEIGSDTNRFTNAYFNGATGVKTLNLNVETYGTIANLIVGSSSAVTSVESDFNNVSQNHDQLVSAKAVKDYIDLGLTAQDLDITDGTNTGSVDLDSASLTFTGSTGIGAVVNNGTVTFTTTDSEIVHDNLSGFVGNEHVDHSTVSISTGNGLTGGGDITATRTLAVDPHTGIAVTPDGVALSHLGLESLADPNADRVAFWDDSEGAFKWLTMGSNLSITDTTLNATDTNTTYSAATSSVLGLVEIFSDTTQTAAAQNISSTSGRTYGSQLNSANQLVVNVPWTDTTYSTATDSTLGLVKLGSSTEQTTAAQSVTATANRSYAVQLDGNSKMVVNVPWVDTNTNTTYSAGTGLTLDGTTFNANVAQTAQSVAANALTATNNRTYAVQVTSNDDLVVNVPWTDTNTNTTYSAGTGITLTDTTFSIGQAVGTSDNVTFNNMTVSGNLTVSGTTTTVNTETINLADNQIVLNSNFSGANPTENGGIEVERGDQANKTLVWDETDDKWTVGSETFVAGTFEGNLTGNVTGTATNLDVADDTQVWFGDDNDLRIMHSTSLSKNLITGFGTNSEIDIQSHSVRILNNGGNVQADFSTNGDETRLFYAGGEKLATKTGGVSITGDATVSNDIIMSAGTSDWKFEVGASNEVLISYGGTNMFKLDSSGNLTVRGNVTAYDTSL